MILTEWKIEDQLGSPQDVAGYLNAALETGDREILLAALGDITRVASRKRDHGASGKAVANDNEPPSLEDFARAIAEANLRFTET